MHDALVAIDDAPVDVPKFVTYQPSKLDIAKMATARFVVAAIPVVIGAGVAAVAGTNAGVAAGLLTGGALGVSKAKKEIAKSTGGNVGKWDIIGRIIANLFELFRSFKPKNGG